MSRRFRFLAVACTLFGTGLLAGCADFVGPLLSPLLSSNTVVTVVDGSTGGNPDFYWLPPTVARAPSFSGEFDRGALGELSVQVCELGADDSCAGSYQVVLDSKRGPSRITMDQRREHYSVVWNAAQADLKQGKRYRAAVLRDTTTIGWLDVSFVGRVTKPGRSGLDITFRFRVETSSLATNVKINEIESNGGVPGDWVELINPGTTAADLSGYILKDAEDDHIAVLPAGTTIPAGGFLVVEEATLGYGLGGDDAVRFFAPDGVTILDSHAWPSHAPTSYGRCPDGTGEFQTTAIPTKGGPNDCSATVVINEIESNGGVPGDWVELYNPGPLTAVVGGFAFRDAEDDHVYTIPAGLTIPAGGYLVLDEADDFDFGLGGADSARLFDAAGELVDSYSWTSHAATTYGRCPNGTGEFVTTAAPTKGAANACAPAVTGVVVNEVESSGGVPGDWIELYNNTSSPIDLSGWIVRDNDDTHTTILPSGSIIPANGFFIVEEATLGYGLGSPDAARLFDPNGVLVDSRSWTPHAPTTYGLCPDGTGVWAITTAPTKGAPNDCEVAVVINEVESNGGTPGDWVELYNPGPAVVDLAGYVFRDNADGAGYTIPAGATIPVGGYYLLEEADFGFGLGGGDSARLFAPDGGLVDSYTWTAHAATTYGRCPNGSGEFATTTASTKGAANACEGEVVVLPWPGDAAVTVADEPDTFGGDLSGLSYDPSGVLWAVHNGEGSLWRLVLNGGRWVPDAATGWETGKLLRYTDGAGTPDAEGVTYSPQGIYVATERNNASSGVSRNSILRFEASGTGPELVATHEWNLSSDIPATGANGGLEAVVWVPDNFLVAEGFVDQALNKSYSPADYPNHGTGLFLVGVESTGMIHAYALNHATGGFTRVASFPSGFPGVMALDFDIELNQFWAVCDEVCGGQSAILAIDDQPGSDTLGEFVVKRVFERPSGMPNYANEGFAIATQAGCAGGLKPVWYADDSETDGHAIRQAMVTCTPFEW